MVLARALQTPRAPRSSKERNVKIFANTPTRTAATVSLILASVTALGCAVWGPGLFSDYTGRAVGPTWLAFAIGGTLGLLGLLVSHKHLSLGRTISAVGGLVHLAVLAVYDRIIVQPMVLLITIGLILLATAAFIGPVGWRPGRALVTRRSSGT
jgi:hypothetical protein